VERVYTQHTLKTLTKGLKKSVFQTNSIATRVAYNHVLA